MPDMDGEIVGLPVSLLLEEGHSIQEELAGAGMSDFPSCRFVSSIMTVDGSGSISR